MPDFLSTAETIAREAGALLVSFYNRGVAFELKGEWDLVTAADRASETLIVGRLSDAFPDHGIVAEEGGGQAQTSDFCWYVDPLDGTTNFAHGFPAFNVTLAVAKAGVLEAGVVYDPLRDEMFAARRGGGATLNGKPIRVSHHERLADSLVATGFPSRRRHQNINIHFYHQLGMATHGVRRAGAAALDLAYVACGRLDAFWEFGLKPWDMAAGNLLVQEAGGAVSDMHGGAHHLSAVDLVADNGLIHEEIVGLFGEIFRGEFRFPLPAIDAELAG